MVDVDQAEFTKKAVDEWTQELMTACHEASQANTFEEGLKKRLLVQKFLHSGLQKQKKILLSQKVKLQFFLSLS